MIACSYRSYHFHMNCDISTGKKYKNKRNTKIQNNSDCSLASDLFFSR